jgi:hypothetical protein
MPSFRPPPPLLIQLRCSWMIPETVARKQEIRAEKAQTVFRPEKHKAKQFEPGDFVLLKYNRFGPEYKAPSPRSQKLGPLSTPLRVLERSSSLFYRLDLPSNSCIHDVISIIHLKEFKAKAKTYDPSLSWWMTMRSGKFKALMKNG